MYSGSLNDETNKVSGDYLYVKKGGRGCACIFGFDPVWALSNQNLSFTNNVKMKLSIILGVIHMTMGIICKGTNAVYFRQWDVLFTEVVTGLIILWALFGWMDYLIYAKWLKPLDIEDQTIRNKDELYDTLQQDEEGNPIYQGEWQNQHTPSIINIIINTVFNFGDVPDNEQEFVPLVGDSQEEQYSIALALLILALSLIPIMLLVRPIFFRQTGDPDQPHENNEIELVDNPRDSAGAGSQGSEGTGRTSKYVNIQKDNLKSIEQQIKELGKYEHEHSFGEAFIH